MNEMDSCRAMDIYHRNSANKEFEMYEFLSIFHPEMSYKKKMELSKEANNEKTT